MDEPGSWCLLGAFICLAATTYFSSAFIALRHLLWAKIEEAFSQQAKPERTKTFRKQQTRLVGSTATLRLCSNLGLFLFVTAYFLTSNQTSRTPLFWPLTQAFVLSTCLLAICSIAIPHAWAKHAGPTLLVRSYPLLRILAAISQPLTWLWQLIDLIIRRLAGIAPPDANGRIEEKHEELLNYVEEGEKEGIVDEQERHMIESVLEFGETTAGEIMTPRTDVVGIAVESPLHDAVEIVIRHGHSRYPVYQTSIDNVIGMLYAKDLLQELKQPGQSKIIKDRLREPYFVPETKPLPDLLHDFQQQKIHLAVVLDEYGGTAGVVTIEDILEEIVGEITDEYERPQAEPLIQIDPHTFEIDARYAVDELNDKFDLNIPEDDAYETVGGFAFSKLGCIPRTGHTFEHKNLHFTIIDAGQRKINRLRIRICTHAQESD